MFVFNNKTNSWSNWIGLFGNDRVEIALSIDSDHPIAWQKKVANCRINVHSNQITEGSFTSLPEDILAQMRKFLGTELTKFLCDFKMRYIDYAELKRERSAMIANGGLRLQDLGNIKKSLMLPIANPANQFPQDYISLGFWEEE
jgi:hypothetical protein